MADHLGIPSSKLFTLAEAAAHLDKSERTIHRLINAGKIRAEKLTVEGRSRRVIKGSEITRYKVFESGWLDRQFSPIPPLDGYKKRLGVTFTFGSWGTPLKGEQVSSRAFILEPDQLPTFKLQVSLDVLWRFVRQRLQSKKKDEKLENEVRSLLPRAPENFKVRFQLDNQTEETLKRIVKSVRPYQLSSITEEELQQEALEHIVLNVLPQLWRAERGWIAYVRQGVRNFYIDKYRESKRREIPLSDLADQDLLSDMDYRNWKEGKDN